MEESKYSKYVVSEPKPHPKVQPELAHHTKRRDKGYLEGWMRPAEGQFLPTEALGDCRIRCVIARQLGLPDPQPFLDAHTHGADEIIMFLSTTPDGTLGADVDIQMGEEGEHHKFNKTTVVYAPKGLLHGPIWYSNFEEGRVFYLITIMLQAEYD
ncbi:MAG TPA: hypothetical protein VMT62_16310 [Syntrophorhabdaceae bacterium]|nr:hypothetical protein [Syntrophorhabdaceae bacterium]